MNITDYLVNYLKQGHPVDVPGIGTLVAKEIDAHFDSATATFYPSETIILIETANAASSHFVEHLAEKECVEKSTAQKIWKNYCDAINDRLTAEGVCPLAGFGSIVKENDGIHFVMSQSPVGQTLFSRHRINNIRTYDVPADDDPFLIYEKEWIDGNDNTTVPLTAASTPSNPRTIGHSAGEASAYHSAGGAPAYQTQRQTEVSASSAKTELPVQSEQQPETEPNVEPDHRGEANDSTSGNETSDGILTHADQPADNHSAETTTTGKAHDPAADDTSAHHASGSDDMTKDHEQQNANVFDENDTLKQLEAIENSDGSDEAFLTNNRKEDEKHKKGSFWKTLLWILAILFVLLACAFVIDRYIFNSKGCGWLAEKSGLALGTKESEEIPDTFPHAPQDYDREAARDNMTESTLSLGGLSYTEQEIAQQSWNIVDYMMPFLGKKLTAMGYGDKTALLREKANDYCHKRLTELLTDNDFHAEALFNYDDYVREELMDYLKDVKMRRRSNMIQSELMLQRTFDELLDGIVDRDVITPSETDVPPEPHRTPTATTTTRNAKPAPVRSQVLGSSKQGFDVIAGYTANKEHATQLASTLKSKGCDAYVIQINDGYYISMGSAASHTAIDATFKHIKEWYQGDIYIKKW